MWSSAEHTRAGAIELKMGKSAAKLGTAPPSSRGINKRGYSLDPDAAGPQGAVRRSFGS